MGTFHTQIGNFAKPSRPVGIGQPLIIPILTNSIAARLDNTGRIIAIKHPIPLHMGLGTGLGLIC